MNALAEFDMSQKHRQINRTLYLYGIIAVARSTFKAVKYPKNFGNIAIRHFAAASRVL
jgi:hypothetical protein